MNIIFNDVCEQDLMVRSVKQHIIQVANKLATVPRTVEEEKKKSMPAEFYELRDWLGIYQTVWNAEIKEYPDD